MPNIKVYGFSTYLEDVAPHGMVEPRAKLLYSDIINRTKSLSFKDEMVFTFVNSICIDRKEDTQPFIHLWSSEDSHIDPILECLQGIGMDVEFDSPKRKGFIPR